MSAADDLGKVADAMRDALRRNPEGSAPAAEATARILRDQKRR